MELKSSESPSNESEAKKKEAKDTKKEKKEDKKKKKRHNEEEELLNLFGAGREDDEDDEDEPVGGEDVVKKRPAGRAIPNNTGTAKKETKNKKKTKSGDDSAEESEESQEPCDEVSDKREPPTHTQSRHLAELTENEIEEGMALLSVATVKQDETSPSTTRHGADSQQNLAPVPFRPFEQDGDILASLQEAEEAERRAHGLFPQDEVLFEGDSPTGHGGCAMFLDGYISDVPQDDAASPTVVSTPATLAPEDEPTLTFGYDPTAVKFLAKVQGFV